MIRVMFPNGPVKNTLTLIVVLFGILLLSCGPSKEEIDKAHAENHARAQDGMGCTDTTAYYAAYFELRRALKHPDASDLDSLHEATISRKGDTVSVSMDALASNAFGVRDRVSIFADFYCKNDSLYWWSAIGTGGFDPDVRRGKPVEALASIQWARDERERRQKAHDAEMDSLRRSYGIEMESFIPVQE